MSPARGVNGGTIRSGGRPGRSDPRGNSKTRRIRREKLSSRGERFGGSAPIERTSSTYKVTGPGDVPCVHCGTRLTMPPVSGGQKPELDRIEEGGSYAMNNLQPSCPTCNKARNAHDWKSPLSQGALPGVGHPGAPLSQAQFAEHNIRWP